MKRIKLFVPVLVFVLMAAFLLVGLGKDPSELPSMIEGKPLPEFNLLTLDSNLEDSVTNEELVGEPFLMNVWATWCASCLIEHPYLFQLFQSGIPIVGINYKDDPSAAIKWLEKYKNPYAVTVVDETGRLGFDLGVTGAPETFVVDASGVIVYRHIGVVDERVWNEHFLAYFDTQNVETSAQN